MPKRTLPDPLAPDVEASSTVGRRRLWPYALTACAILVGLSLAAWVLLTGSDSTTDDVVIVTTPSGADIEFDGTSLGPSPVKLDRVRVGPHHVRIRRDGFFPIDETVHVEVDRDGPIRFALKPVAPEGSAARTPQEQIAEFQQLARKALERGVLVDPYLKSALYYADAVLAIDASDRVATEVRAEIRERLLSTGKRALERRDTARAKTVFEQLLEAFPGDPDGIAGLEAARDPGRRPATRPKRP